jgi:transcriptional regulator with XRE-family HTH domain
MSETDTRIGEAVSRRIAERIREELARRRITRAKLAADARISLSTLEKVLSGRRQFTLTTVVRLEDALGLMLRNGEHRSNGDAASNSGASGHAPDELGSYARPAVRWLEGAYVTLRPSFGDRHAIYAYRTEIRWDEAQGCLAFTESDRVDADFTQFGIVSVPHQSGYIYLVTNRHGQYRLIVVSRPTIAGEMHGLLTTLQVGRGAHLTPVATPIVLAPMARFPEPEYGPVRAGSRHYEAYRRLLRRTVDEPFALLLPG